MCIECVGKHSPEGIQRKYVTLCTIIYLNSDVVCAMVMWQFQL